MRQRGQQRIAQTLGFHAYQRVLRHFDIMHALQRNRGQGGERVQLLLLFRDQDPAPAVRQDHQHAPGTHRRHQRQIQIAAGRQRIGADAGATGIIESPLGNAHVQRASDIRHVIRYHRRHLQSTCIVRYQQQSLGLETALQEQPAGFKYLFGLQHARQGPGKFEQSARACFTVRSNPRLIAQSGG